MVFKIQTSRKKIDIKNKFKMNKKIVPYLLQQARYHVIFLC